MKTIVALVDFSDSTSKILYYTLKLASAFGSQVILLHIVPPEIPVVAYGAEVPPIPVDPSPETMRDNQAKLDALLQSFTRQGLDARAVQCKGPISETALAEIAHLKADLVIMGSHHHNALYHLLIGSTSADVLKHATFPLLLVPCDVPEQEDK
jgi:nucleotide-binding universal stress UspA family protein